MVTIGGRSELKPVVGTAGNQVTTLQAQQLKTVQVTDCFVSLQDLNKLIITHRG